MRPVTAAVGSGSLTSLAIAVAKEILWSDRMPPLPGPSEICPVLEGLVPPPWAFDLYSFALGICVGLAILPFLDFLILVRLAWGRLVVQQQLRGARQRFLHRVLE